MGAFIAIDMKAFYASVECVYRDLDPLQKHRFYNIKFLLAEIGKSV